MRYDAHAPPAPLAGIVDHLWSLSDTPSHAKERIVPSGTVELVINLQRDQIRVFRPSSTGEGCVRLRGAVVSGAYSRSFVVDTQAHASIVGVHFKPGRASALLGVAAGELADAHVELDALWGPRAVELRERLCTAAPTERFAILEEALIDMLPRARPSRAEVDVALGRLGAPGVEVAGVAREVQLSHRRFIELFSEQVGMTPKRFARVRRFQRALALATSRRSPTWTQVALECGYYDQAHLCHDWIELSGFSPAELLRLRGARVKENHVAEPEPSGSTFSNTRRRSARTLRRARGG